MKTLLSITCGLLLGCSVAQAQTNIPSAPTLPQIALSLETNTVTTTTVTVPPLVLPDVQMDAIIRALKLLGISAGDVTTNNLQSVTLTRQALQIPIYKTNRTEQVQFIADPPPPVETNSFGAVISYAVLSGHWETNTVPQLSVSWSNAVVFRVEVGVQ